MRIFYVDVMYYTVCLTEPCSVYVYSFAVVALFTDSHICLFVLCSVPRNCLFRALAVQLRGADHRSLRRDVVRYMREHRDEFEPFIDDQTSFEEYSTHTYTHAHTH